MLTRHVVALTSSALAPAALIGGWTVAATRQPARYDAWRDTISALAAHGARDRWIMTVALAVLGICHLVSAACLTEAGRVARAVLAVGGAATVLVAVFAQPSSGHVPAATVGFLALTAWPALWRSPRRSKGIVVAVLLAAALIWLGVELGGGAQLGVAERVLAGAQALVPWVLALSIATKDPTSDARGASEPGLQT